MEAFCSYEISVDAYRTILRNNAEHRTALVSSGRTSNRKVARIFLALSSKGKPHKSVHYLSHLYLSVCSVSLLFFLAFILLSPFSWPLCLIISCLWCIVLILLSLLLLIRIKSSGLFLPELI
jgi:hypothetical protein